MEFWSKGLGKKRINLYLGKTTAVKSGEKLYLCGQLEAPVSWEFIMPLTAEDIVDFFHVLRDPSLAAYLSRSPHRWRLYGTMLVGGLQLVLLAVTTLFRSRFERGGEEEPAIQVPPVPERRQRSVRRRLGSKTAAASTPEESADVDATRVA